MMETLNDLIVGIAEAACSDTMMVAIRHDGPAARYLALDPGGGCHEVYAQEGTLVRVPRSFRLVVQPLYQVAIYAPHYAAKRWSTV